MEYHSLVLWRHIKCKGVIYDMQDEKDCTAFNTFGSDLKEARNALGMSRRVLAEKVGMDPRYLANIENSGFIPSLSNAAEKPFPRFKTFAERSAPPASRNAWATLSKR